MVLFARSAITVFVEIVLCITRVAAAGVLGMDLHLILARSGRPAEIRGDNGRPVSNGNGPARPLAPMVFTFEMEEKRMKRDCWGGASRYRRVTVYSCMVFK